MTRTDASRHTGRQRRQHETTRGSVRKTVALLGLCGVLVVAAGPAVRRFGGFGDHTETALYAVLIYLLVCLVTVPSVIRPQPLAVACTAVGVCWLIEVFQLTGVPARWAAHSSLSRLVLGVRFQWWDLAWYLTGATTAGILHAMTRRRRAALVAPARWSR